MDIESLQIEIVSESDKATKNLSKLTKSLEKLDAMGKSTGFDELYQKLQKLSSLDFSNLAGPVSTSGRKTSSGKGTSQPKVVGGKTFSEAKATQAEMAKHFDIVKVDAADSFIQAENGLVRLSHKFNLVRENIRKTTAELMRFAELTASLGWTQGGATATGVGPSDFGNGGTTGSGFRTSWSDIPFGGNLGDGSPNWTRWNPYGSYEHFRTYRDMWSRNDFGKVPTSHRLGDGTIELGEDDWYEVTRFRTAFDNLKRSMGNISDECKRYRASMEASEKKTRGLGTAIKTILMYSVLFKIMSTITEGFTEGLQNVTRYGEEANEVMTRYNTLNLELKNAVGAAAVPALESFYPLVATVADVAIDAANSVNILFSALNGDKTFTKAKKYVDDYAKSLNNLKGTTGLDQINTLSKGYDYSEMFEEVEIDSGEVADAALNIAGLVGGVIAFKTVLSSLKSSALIQTLTGKLTDMGTEGSSALGKISSAVKSFKTTLIGAGGIVAGFALTKNGAEELTKSLSSDTGEGLGGALFSLVGGVAAGAAGGAMIGGPVGAVLGGLGALIGTIPGVIKAEEELRRQMVETAFLDNYGLNLEELTEHYKDAWGEAITLGEESQRARDAIDESAEKIGAAAAKMHPYITKLQETGTTTNEEAGLIRGYVEEMVNGLQYQMETRTESILNTFNGLFEQAGQDLSLELGKMESDFLAFKAIFSDVTEKYQFKVETILDKATAKDEQGNYIGLSQEDKRELSNTLDKLAALNVEITPEQYAFDNLVAEASRGLEIESVEDARQKIAELTEFATAYRESIETAYENAKLDIETLKLQNQALYESGEISKADKDYFDQAFSVALMNLGSAYNLAGVELGQDIKEIVTAIQVGAVANLGSVVENAEGEYENLSWWDKLLGVNTNSKEAYIQAAIDAALKDLITPITNELASFAEGSLTTVNLWSADMVKTITDYMYDTERHATMDAAGNATTTTVTTQAMTFDEAFKKALADFGISIPGYVTGGFPEDGLFMANSGELVGKFTNGRTAVANNTQIIEGIKQGVKEANLETGGVSGGDWIIQIVSPDGTVQSETIITAAERRNRRDGRTVIPLGV